MTEGSDSENLSGVGSCSGPTPRGGNTPNKCHDKLYEIYYRFLETDDAYFDYAPADVPPQGRWRIYGVNLPETILRKVYFENADHQLNVVV